MKNQIVIIGISLCLSACSMQGEPFAYVTSSPRGVIIPNGSVTPIDVATNMPGTSIAVGPRPELIAITFDDATAYVANVENFTLQAITIATNTAGPPIPLSIVPAGIAITPDDKTAYITGFNKVVPFDLATQTFGPAITVGPSARGIAITPDGKFAYVVSNLADDVSVIDIATNTVLPTTIPVGLFPQAIAITPDGKFAYVGNVGGGSITPITIATNSAGPAIFLSHGPQAIAITRDSKFVYVANADGWVSVINIANNTILTSFNVATDLVDIAMTPDGKFAYVTSFGLLGTDGAVVPITIADNTLGTAIPLEFAFAIAMTHKVIPPQPAAPTNFIGTIRCNVFLNKTEFVLMATFKASSATNIAEYRIYNGTKIIATIKPTDPLQFNSCVACNFNSSAISVTAVDSDGNESDHLILSIQ